MACKCFPPRSHALLHPLSCLLACSVLLISAPSLSFPVQLAGMPYGMPYGNGGMHGFFGAGGVN